MPSSTETPELSLRAVAIGLVLSIVMGAANVYLGLKAGMTVSASIPAAVVGMLLLRSVFRGGSVLEANQIQTAASAGESLAAGVIFTLPALLLIGVWQDFDMLTTTLVAFAGGLLGILFMIPMRRVFVVDNPELPYPEGVACASVLRAVEGTEAASASDARSVLHGGLFGAAFKFLISFLGLLKGSLEAATFVGAGRVLFLGADISPALFAVGFIVRLNVALLIFLGGAIGWLVCIPLLPEINTALGALAPQLAHPIETEGDAVAQAWTLWSRGVRYVGVGAMVVGGVASIIRVRSGLGRALAELRSRIARPNAPEDDDSDLPSTAIAGLLLLAVGAVASVYYIFTSGLAITVLTTLIMVAMSFFFVAVASYIVGLVGNSNSPVSGMTITAVLFTGAVLWLFGFAGQEGMLATLGVAAVVCCAACTSGDVCNDLKTGSLVGASPRRQQLMQVAGVAVASLVMAPILSLLHEAYTIGSKELSAPQASLFASLARGLFGDGELPWGLIAVGAALGLVIQAVDWRLERRGSTFRLHLMPVAVGIYLPFGLSIPILLGGISAHLHARSKTPGGDGSQQRGVLFASGVIAGESLVGVLVALLLSAGVSGQMGAPPMQSGLTLGAALLGLGLCHRLTRPRAN